MEDGRPARHAVTYVRLEQDLDSHFKSNKSHTYRKHREKCGHPLMS